jgi:hypothetical protein
MKPKLKVVKTEDRNIDELEVAMRSAMHSLRASRTWEEHKLAHLLNCREALDRVSFYLDDEINEELGRDRGDTD